MQIWKLTAAFLVGILANNAMAATTVVVQPKIIIVIDNLGDQKQQGLKVADLPGQVACSILPHGRFSAQIAERCHAQHKTIILNTPMQAQNNYPLGAGGLQEGMSKLVFIKTLTDNIASVPYVQGLDNHMGSLLTTRTEPMSWIMETIKPQGLFFLDNRTAPHSVAARMAQANQVPFIGRDIFLDDKRTTAAINKQFNEALKIAKRHGVVVIVGHPYSVTLDYLQASLPLLAAQGYELATIPQALNLKASPVMLTTTQQPAPIAQKPIITKKPLIIKKPALQATKPETIDIAAITPAISSSVIELTVDKKRQVVVKKVDVIKKSDLPAAQVTAKASHSLVQTFKDNLCKKYAHFCGHTNHTPATQAINFANAPFTDLQGKLHWPTQGEIVAHFGAELGDSKLKYNGVLIQAPAGQPVHAIYGGHVIFANWLHGLGLLLIVDHGNGYMSLYGHNAALYKKVGDSVKPEDLIAAVGNSGVPGPTGLYFEIRHNGQPINPEQWCS